MTEKPKRPRDPNQLAKFIADLATGDADPRVIRDGGTEAGVAGGKARSRALTEEQRRDIARIAADARWKKS